MKKLNIDTGVEEFSVNGQGVLRFNPADPNLYHRFFAAGRTLNDYDAALTRLCRLSRATSRPAPRRGCAC